MFYFLYTFAIEDINYSFRGYFTMISKKLINFKKIKKFIIIEIFYKNYIWFVVQGSPWFSRGVENYVGAFTGVFSFGNQFGNTVSSDSFRANYYELLKS